MKDTTLEKILLVVWSISNLGWWAVSIVLGYVYNIDVVPSKNNFEEVLWNSFYALISLIACAGIYVRAVKKGWVFDENEEVEE